MNQTAHEYPDHIITGLLRLCSDLMVFSQTSELQQLVNERVVFLPIFANPKKASFDYHCQRDQRTRKQGIHNDPPFLE